MFVILVSMLFEYMVYYTLINPSLHQLHNIYLTLCPYLQGLLIMCLVLGYIQSLTIAIYYYYYYLFYNDICLQILQQLLINLKYIQQFQNYILQCHIPSSLSISYSTTTTYKHYVLIFEYTHYYLLLTNFYPLSVIIVYLPLSFL